MNPATLSSTPFLQHPSFTELDRHFAAFMEELAGGSAPAIALAAALVSHFRHQGHVCLDLAGLNSGRLARHFPGATPALPPWAEWKQLLTASPVVGGPGDFRPLILDGEGRLYLHRYWEFEQHLAGRIQQLRRQSVAVDREKLKEGLQRLFPTPPVPGGPPDWQKVAAYLAVTRPLAIITGGPGTGKTTTVLKVLSLVLEQLPPANRRLALAAPTGKAATRLLHSIQAALTTLPVPEAVRQALPTSAQTIHRLLGGTPDLHKFRHGPEHLLPLDLLIVDEASMIDLALMSRLLEALPSQARVVLLGDRDQLSSVEAGAVLGDLCGTVPNLFSAAFSADFHALTGETIPSQPDQAPSALLPDGVVQLEKNHRFGNESGIFALSQAVRQADLPGARALLAPGRFGDLLQASLPAAAQLSRALEPLVLEQFGRYLRAQSPLAALEELGRFRILAVVREGPYGITNLNHLVEGILEKAGLISRRNPFYSGRPILITQNDYNLKLFNGDVGLLWPHPVTGQVRAWFPDTDQPSNHRAGGSITQETVSGVSFVKWKESICRLSPIINHLSPSVSPGGLRELLPLRLPEHETVFAMTVHKSQGSEFEKILLVLPERDNPVLTRELIYTGLTRARQQAILWHEEGIFEEAVLRQVNRTSGLGDLLRAGL